MIKGTMLIVFLLIVGSTFSQSIYPRQIVLPTGDTIIAITHHQMDIINDEFILCDKEQDINDSLLVTIDSCSKAFIIFEDAIISLKLQLHMEEQFITQQTSVIDTLHKVVTDQKTTISHLKGQLKRHKIFSGALEGVLAVIVVWLVLR